MSWKYVSMTSIEKQEGHISQRVHKTKDVSPRTLAVSARRRPAQDRKLNKEQIRCYNCGKIGPVARNCKTSRKKKRDRTAKHLGRDGEERLASVKMMNISKNKQQRKALSCPLLLSQMIVDNGGSEHVIGDACLFHSLHGVEEMEVDLPNGTSTSSNKQGLVSVEIGHMKLMLRSVYYITALTLNALSCSRLDEHGISTEISNGSCKLIDRGQEDKLLATVMKSTSDGLYAVNTIRRKDASNPMKQCIATQRTLPSDKQKTNSLDI